VSEYLFNTFMASTTHMTYHQSLWMMQFNRPQLVSVHYSTTLTGIALQQQNFTYYSSETFAALSQFQTVESLSSAKSLVSPKTCKFWGKQHLKMRHYQNISKKVRGLREILSHCTAYTVINKQALQHISHSFQVLPSTHPNWLPIKMFKKCHQYNIIWKHKSSLTRIQTLVYKCTLTWPQNSIYWKDQVPYLPTRQFGVKLPFGLNELWGQDQQNTLQNGVAKAIPDSVPE